MQLPSGHRDHAGATGAGARLPLPSPSPLSCFFDCLQAFCAPETTFSSSIPFRPLRLYISWTRPSCRHVSCCEQGPHVFLSRPFRQATSQRPDPMPLPVLLSWLPMPSGPLGGCVSPVYSTFEDTAGVYSLPCSGVRPGKQADLGDGTLASRGYFTQNEGSQWMVVEWRRRACSWLSKGEESSQSRPSATAGWVGRSAVCCGCSALHLLNPGVCLEGPLRCQRAPVAKLHDQQYPKQLRTFGRPHQKVWAALVLPMLWNF
jgi:hypothetical protein